MCFSFAQKRLTTMYRGTGKFGVFHAAQDRVFEGNKNSQAASMKTAIARPQMRSVV